ncbi:sec-independent protein translocase protein TATB, chloroplastic-like [Impatiens glandulifera]|uniref:sec-independent protein translocase protein TATB, chloroplastic-like n=1 Tax=Impatiens glandulifera TaxID=253017 RepID=UPI001FB12402|nr:sec-independent protein translocase protein TATB, chloroplastic-like [Impatiens glandulifera]
MIATMTASSPTCCISSSSTPSSGLWNHRPICRLPSASSSVDSHPKCRWNPQQQGLTSFSSWDGLRLLGVSIPKQSAKIERKKAFRRCKGNNGVNASLFGVGAPEALVVGVVALLVFGPKGLAEVARNLGKTLRAFQPTIRELQDVSREFKSSLEREIGLDETQEQSRRMYTSNTMDFTSVSQTDTDDPVGIPSSKRTSEEDEYSKLAEEQLKASSVAQQQKETPPPLESNQSDLQT